MHKASVFVGGTAPIIAGLSVCDRFESVNFLAGLRATKTELPFEMIPLPLGVGLGCFGGRIVFVDLLLGALFGVT